MDQQQTQTQTQMQKDIDAYIAQLSEMEKKVLNIATLHLESSFSLVKSIGFQEWLNQQKAVALQKALAR
jgi:hypothetical protein